MRVCKSSLRSEQQMTDCTVSTEEEGVRKAAQWARSILAAVHQGPGDDNLEDAMHRAETTYGIPFSTFWSLRFRPPKTIGVAAWFRIKHVYDAICAAQEARLEHDLTLIRALPPNPARQALIAQIESELGIAPGKTGTEG